MSDYLLTGNDLRPKLSQSHKRPNGNKCAHCERKMNDYAGGSIKVNGNWLCHPNAANRPNCYQLVTLYNHSMPCANNTCYEDHADQITYIAGDNRYETIRAES